MIYRIAPERLLTYRVLVFLAAVLSALGFALLATRAPRALPELKTDDALARLAPRPARPDVVIVALDDASIKQYGPGGSWRRGALAQVLSRIEAGQPRAVVLDLALDQRTQTGDEALWRQMANKQNVILGMAYDANRAPQWTPDDIRALRFLEKFAIADNLTFGPQTQNFAYPFFEPPMSDFAGSAAGVGVFDRETDEDGGLRRARLFYRSTVEYPQATRQLPGKFPDSHLADGVPVALPNIALVAALRVFQLNKNSVHVRSGDTVYLAGNLNPPVNIPVDAQGRMLIRYAAPGRYATYSFADVLAGRVKPDFHDKVVLIGSTSASDQTTHLQYTPVSPAMPRVEVTANALSTLLDRSFVEVVNSHPSHAFGVLILLGVVTGLLLMILSGGRGLLAGLVLLLAYLGLCYGLFVSNVALLPILPGVLVILLPMLISLLLYLGPFRPSPVQISPTYVAPPAEVVHE